MAKIDFRLQSAQRKREQMLSAHKKMMTVESVDHKVRDA